MAARSAVILAKLVLCAVVLAAPASAADLGRRMPVKATMAVPPPFTWTGCYVGGYVGGAWSDDVTFTDLGNANFGAFSGGLTTPRVERSHSWSFGLDHSVIAGGTVGCNWQAPGSPLVLGVEGEIGYIRLEGSGFDPLISPTLTVAALRGTLDTLGSATVGDWYGMITGRLGVAWDRVLLYVKGGAAFVPVTVGVNDNCLVVARGCGNWIIGTGVDDTITAATVGGGVEWAFAPNWSVKAEYMFIALDETLTSCGLSINPAGGIMPGGPFCFNHDLEGIHTAKVGLNFRFSPFGR
jgi:outer membrane immunogenic protein